MVSASIDVDGLENLNERYVFYVVPLSFIGLAIWIKDSLPRPKPWAWAALALCCAAPVLIPKDSLRYNADFQSVALIPWLVLPVGTVALGGLVAVFTVASGSVWATCRAEVAGRLWVLVGAWLVVAGVFAVGAQSTSAAQTTGFVFADRSRTWVDDNVPPGERVQVIWDQRRSIDDRPDSLYAWLMATELFNDSLDDVVRVGPPTYYDSVLPTVPARVDADGVVSTRADRPLISRFVLVTCRTSVPGKVVATAPEGALSLVETTGPVRVSPDSCRRS
jgi:hypothetical protein